MEELFIECRDCSSPAGAAVEMKFCGLCNEAHCADCLNEAGLCVPCGQKTDFSKEEAIAV